MRKDIDYNETKEENEASKHVSESSGKPEVLVAICDTGKVISPQIMPDF